MAARLIGFSILGLAAFALLLAAVYITARALDRNKVKPELDISIRPSMWWTDTRAVMSGTRTEVSIVRVDDRTHEVLERRILAQIDNADPFYGDWLDEHQDRAYEVARNANLGLVRR